MNEAKAAVSIAEMSRMVGLSRARFYQLMGKTFPWPLYSVSNRRPFYDEVLQEVCLSVRRRNCGIDGKPILFYSRRINHTTIRKLKKPPVKVEAAHDEILEGLRGLGLTTATNLEVASVVKELFPKGVNNESRGQVLRAVFLKLKRRDRFDNNGDNSPYQPS